MSGDFSAILLLVLVVAGVILLVDLLILKPGRVAAGRAGPVDSRALTREPVAVGLARSALPVLVFVLLFRSFLFEPFRIPSASMMPGLVDGDSCRRPPGRARHPDLDELAASGLAALWAHRDADPPEVLSIGHLVANKQHAVRPALA